MNRFVKLSAFLLVFTIIIAFSVWFFIQYLFTLDSADGERKVPVVIKEVDTWERGSIC